VNAFTRFERKRRSKDLYVPDRFSAANFVVTTPAPTPAPATIMRMIGKMHFI
jgi:hypothetical protein